MNTAVLLIFAVAGITYAALAIWVTVRLVNRKERWAKRTMVWLTVAPVLYFLSTGPAIWIYFHYLPRSFGPVIGGVYFPINLLAQSSPTVASITVGYMDLWVSQDDQIKKWEEP
jgi:hypothetical protein